MPISGLVLSLTPDAVVDDLVAELSGEPRIDIGVPQGRRLPVVLETADSDEDRDVWNWLRHLPQVFHVDVSFIHFDESRTTSDSSSTSESSSSSNSTGSARPAPRTAAVRRSQDLSTQENERP